MPLPEPNQNTRRGFILSAAKAGTLVALFPLVPTGRDAHAACAFAYGSGLYGRGCYAGTIPNLLRLPAIQGNIRQDGFRFFLQGAPNQSYEIQYSTDLANWTSLGTLTMPADGNPLEILDSQTAAAERRFYRANPL